MLPRALIPVIAVAAVFMIALFGFTTGGYALHAVLILAPLAMILAGNLSLILMAIIALIRSTLIIPGLPQGLALVDVFIVFLVLMIVATDAIKKNKRKTSDNAPTALLFFLIIILVTIYLRGIGIRIFGSALWGGMAYIKLLIYIFFYLTCRHIVFSESMMKKALIGMVLLSLVPVAAQLIFLISGGRIYQQFAFVEAYATGLISTLNSLQGGGSTARFYFTGFAMSLLTAGLVFLPFKGWRRLPLLAIIVFSMTTALLSGFRSTILLSTGVLYFYAILVFPRRKTSITLVSGALFIGTLLILMPFVDVMPGSIQRALAWVPFYDIPFAVKIEASYSTEWRLGVWEMAFREIPDYLWVGKGFAFPGLEMVSGFSQRDSQLHAFISHNYHNGPISLLLDFGVFGFITVTVFMILLLMDIKRGYLVMRRQQTNPMMFRWYAVLFATVMYQVFSFYLIYGDARTSINEILFNATILRIILFNHNAQMNAGTVDPATTPSVGKLPSRVVARPPFLIKEPPDHV